jgi:hypothetical protein
VGLLAHPTQRWGVWPKSWQVFEKGLDYAALVHRNQRVDFFVELIWLPQLHNFPAHSSSRSIAGTGWA